MEWSGIFTEAFGYPQPQALTLPIADKKSEVFLYHCVLPDLGVAFDIRIEPEVLVMASGGLPPRTAIRTWKLYKPSAMVVLAHVLAAWDTLDPDQKIWFYSVFKVNLNEARTRAAEFVAARRKLAGL